MPPSETWKMQGGDSYHISFCVWQVYAEDRSLRMTVDYHRLSQGARPVVVADPDVESTTANQCTP